MEVKVAAVAAAAAAAAAVAVVGMAVGVVEVDEGLGVARRLVVVAETVTVEVAEAVTAEVGEAVAEVEAGCSRSNIQSRLPVVRRHIGVFQ